MKEQKVIGEMVARGILKVLVYTPETGVTLHIQTPDGVRPMSMGTAMMFLAATKRKEKSKNA